MCLDASGPSHPTIMSSQCRIVSLLGSGYAMLAIIML